MVVHFKRSRILLFVEWVGMYQYIAIGQLVGMYENDIVYYEHPDYGKPQYRLCYFSIFFCRTFHRCAKEINISFIRIPFNWEQQITANN